MSYIVMSVYYIHTISNNLYWSTWYSSTSASDIGTGPCGPLTHLTIDNIHHLLCTVHVPGCRKPVLRRMRRTWRVPRSWPIYQPKDLTHSTIFL